MEGIIVRPLKLRHVLLRSFPVAVVEIRNAYTMFLPAFRLYLLCTPLIFDMAAKFKKIVVRSLEYFV